MILIAPRKMLVDDIPTGTIDLYDLAIMTDCEMVDTWQKYGRNVGRWASLTDDVEIQ